MEFGYTTLAFRSMFGTNNGIAGQVLVDYGTEEQKRTWLARIASREVVASFALTEPGAGSDPAGLRTKAVRDGDEGMIDGEKRFITNAPSADLFVVFARTRPADTDGPGIAVFLVPADPEATVTAGNSSGQNDAAALCLVTHPERADELGLRPPARLVSWGVAGVRPEAMGIGLGHPVGATGTRMLATLTREMRRRDARYGLVTMCIGGGQGLAAIFEKVSA